MQLASAKWVTYALRPEPEMLAVLCLSLVTHVAQHA